VCAREPQPEEDRVVERESDDERVHRDERAPPHRERAECDQRHPDAEDGPAHCQKVHR
jgi:hypothetical protein